MAWSRAQTVIFLAACRGAKLDDEQRYLILGQCEGRAVVNGKISTTSPRLTNDDFEHCMAVVEGFSGGQVQVWTSDGGDRRRLRYGRHHWKRAAEEGVIKRARFRVQALVERLTDELPDWRANPADRLLAWIRHSSCAPPDRLASIRSVEDLRLEELRNLIDSLTALAKRRCLAGEPNARSHG